MVTVREMVISPPRYRWRSRRTAGINSEIADARLLGRAAFGQRPGKAYYKYDGGFRLASAARPEVENDRQTLRGLGLSVLGPSRDR